MGLRVLILAGRATGYESIQRLLEGHDHTIVGVFSQDYDGLVNDDVTCSDYRELLDVIGVPFWSTDKIHGEDYVEIIRNLEPDIGLSIGWRRLVREPVISIPRHGFFNFHTSDLPKYRGFASTSWAVLNGDQQIAITAHKMISGAADEGDIFLKKYIAIRESTDIGELFEEIRSLIPGMVIELLDGVEKDSIVPIIQNDTESLISLPRRPSDGWIDWSKSALEIDRLVRSVSKPYPGAFTCWNRKKVIIWEGHISKENKNYIGVPGHVIGSHDGISIKVLTGNGIYIITQMQICGEDGISPAKYIRGYQQRLGLSQGEMFEMLNFMWKENNTH